MVNLKEKSESLIKYYIKVTCAFKWARKWPRKTVSYESAKCVPYNTSECNHNGFVSDLLKWALKCRFYATGPWYPANWASKLAGCFLVLQVTVQRLSQSCVYYVRQWSQPGWAGGGGYSKNVYFFTKRGTPFPYLVYDFVSLSTMVWVLFSVFSVLCITSVGDRNRLRFWIKPLKETDLGVAQAFFDP